MIIVIEGTELVGKTTVIDKLHSVISNSIPVKLDVVIDLNRNYVADIEEAINLTAYSIMGKDESKVWLVDRFIVSALIYSKFLDRPCKLSIEDIISRNYTIIILGADDDVLEERYKSRIDKYFSIEQIKKLNKLFFTFFLENKGKIPNLYWKNNCNLSQLSYNIKFIKRLIRHE